MATKKEAGKNKKSFEESLERLEVIVQQMEGGSLSLEDMISRFEEGQALIKFCSGKLNEVERKIEVLIKKGDKVASESLESVSEVEDDDGEQELF